MNYYEHHLGDYLRDTAHLSMLEDAAYRRLLDRIYSTEQGIPADQVYRVVRARAKDEQAAVDAVLAEFFELVDGLYIQGRAMAEIEKAKRRIDAAQRNGRNGGRPKRNQPGSITGTEQKPSGFSLGSESETQSKALQSPISNLHTPEKNQNARVGFDGWAFVEQRMQPKYPKGLFKQPHWITASRAVETLVLEQGVDPELIAANVEAFARECQVNGTEARYVMNPARWLAEGYWRGPFNTSPQVGESPEKIRMREAEVREWAELTRRADASGFRAPLTGESMGAFRTLLQRHEDAQRDERKRSTTGPAPIAALLPTRASA